MGVLITWLLGTEPNAASEGAYSFSLSGVSPRVYFYEISSHFCLL